MVALLLAVTALLALSSTVQAKLKTSCIGDTCTVSGACTDFIAKTNSNWVVKDGVCYRKNGSKTASFPVILQEHVYKMQLEVVSKGTPSSGFRIQAFDFYDTSLSLAKYSESPSLVYLPFDPMLPSNEQDKEKDEDEDEDLVLKRSRVDFVVVHPDKSKRTTFNATTYIPLGSKNSTITLVRLNSANPYDVGIKSVAYYTAQVGRQLPHRCVSP